MAGTSDVGVVGGGVVGLSVARELAKAGRGVTVIEKADFGSGSSAGNAGLVVPSHVVPLAAPGVIGQGLRWLLRRDSPFRIKPRLDLGFLKWLWTFYRSCTEPHVTASIPVLRDLSLASRRLYADWAADDGLADFGFRSTGLLMLHETEKGRKKDLEEADRARDAGLDVRVLHGPDLRDFAPNAPASVLAGVYYEQDALLDPARLVEALRGNLEDEQADLRSGESVTGFRCENGTIRSVETTDGSYEFETVIFAPGAWAGRLGRELDLDIPVEPAKGYSVTLDVPSKQPEIPFILTEDKVSVTPLSDDVVRFAGTLELAGFDHSVDSRRVTPILEVAAEYVPNLHPEEPGSTDPWVGFRPCTPDGLPIIGPVAQYDNLIMATGHSMIGVSLAPITGRLVAEIVTGREPTVNTRPLRLERFELFPASAPIRSPGG